MNILIVEDEPLIADLLSRALEQLGNSCLVARDTDSADEALRRHPVEAVTLDLSMPGRTGLEWLETMATYRPALARRTLVITGQHLEPELVQRLARCGAGVLAKPFTLTGLQDAVRSQIAHLGGPAAN
jgi:two-component system OmpR family response regulator